MVDIVQWSVYCRPANFVLVVCVPHNTAYSDRALLYPIDSGKVRRREHLLGIISYTSIVPLLLAQALSSYTPDETRPNR